MSDLLGWLADAAAARRAAGTERSTLARPPGADPLLDLAGNDHLGLARHPQVVRAAKRLVERGAWVRPFGRLVYTMPPYVSTDDDLDVVTSAIVGALTR